MGAVCDGVGLSRDEAVDSSGPSSHLIDLIYC